MREHFGTDDVPNDIFAFNSHVKVEDVNGIQEVTSRELGYAICKQENNKAPGSDLLDALIVKNVCIKSIKIYVKRLLTTCLRFGDFLKVWKNGLVIFFRKRNKDGKTPRSYHLSHF